MMRERVRHLFSAWAAGALATVGLLPTLIALITVVLVLALADWAQVAGLPVVSQAGRLVAAVLGPALGLLLWLLIGLVATRFTGADQANPVVFSEVTSQVAGLRARIEGACEAEGKAAGAACQAARAHCMEVERVLGVGASPGRPSTGPAWTTGAGYIGIWQRLHRADEALLTVAPVPVVVAEALYDRSRLVGSTIGTRTELLAASAVAVSALDAGAAMLVGGIQLTPATTVVSPPAEPAAREVIRTIRQAINEFRDDRSAELVRLRRRLTQSLLFTGMTAVLVLLLAILGSVPITTILGGVAYYLIGALVGLLQRIHGELELESSVEDYGLSGARLLLAPLVSGLAAIAGVTLISIVSGRPFGLYLVEPAADPPGSLYDAFNIMKYPFGLVVAAAFGLAPGVLLRRLKTVGDSLKVDIQSSEAASRGNPTR